MITRMLSVYGTPAYWYARIGRRRMVVFRHWRPLAVHVDRVSFLDSAIAYERRDRQAWS